MLPQYTRPKTLCYCDNIDNYDCHEELLNPIYPGQTMMLNIYTILAAPCKTFEIHRCITDVLL